MDTMIIKQTPFASHTMLSTRPLVPALWNTTSRNTAAPTTAVCDTTASGTAVGRTNVYAAARIAFGPGVGVEAGVSNARMRDSLALQGAPPPRENPR